MKKKQETWLRRLIWIPLVLAGTVSACDVSGLDGDSDEPRPEQVENTNSGESSPSGPSFQVDQDGSGVEESSLEPTQEPPSRERPLQPDEDGYVAQPTSSATPTTLKNARTR